MNHLSVLEILTIVASFFGCFFAIAGTGQVPRPVWRPAAAAFGAGILSLGVGGTAQQFLEGVRGIAAASPATRELAFQEILHTAYRPMFLATLGLMVFWLVLRTAATGDDSTVTRSPFVPALMQIGAAGSLVSITAWHVALVQGQSPISLLAPMQVTLYLALATVMLCLFSGAWTLLRGYQTAEG